CRAARAPPADQHRVGNGSDPIHPPPILGAGKGGELSGGRGDFSVQTHREVENAVGSAPRPSHDVESWLAGSAAARLSSAGPAISSTRSSPSRKSRWTLNRDQSFVNPLPEGRW